MRTMSQTYALSPSVLILAALAAVVVFVTLRGSALPLLSNLKVNLAILLVLGMAICAQGGIGRVQPPVSGHTRSRSWPTSLAQRFWRWRSWCSSTSSCL